MIDKTRNKVDKCKQKAEETVCLTREHEAAISAAEAEERMLKALLLVSVRDNSTIPVLCLFVLCAKALCSVVQCCPA